MAEAASGSDRRQAEAGVVIVGGGLAGAQVALQLRQSRWPGAITLLSEEDLPPYWRPPLSKSILEGTADQESAWLRPAEFWARRRIDLRLDTKVARLDRRGRSLTTGQGDVLAYHRLVLATGAKCWTPALSGLGLAGVHTLRTMGDTLALREAVTPQSRIAILGGGFIGLEAAASLTARGGRVTVIEREPRLLARVAAPPTSEVVHAMHVAQGVAFFLGRTATGIGGTARAEHVTLDDGTKIGCDAVLICVGVKPDTQLAEASGLACQDGILVNDAALSSDPAIFALGDCARFPSTRYERMLRLESIQNAIDGAAVVASAICGETPKYDPVPMISSLQFGHQLDFIGLANGADRAQVMPAVRGGGYLLLHSKCGLYWAAEGMDLDPNVLATVRTAIENRLPIHEHGIV